MNCCQLSLSPTKLFQPTTSRSVSLISILILSPHPHHGIASALFLLSHGTPTSVTQRSTLVIVLWFAGRTWKNNKYWYFCLIIVGFSEYIRNTRGPQRGDLCFRHKPFVFQSRTFRSRHASHRPSFAHQNNNGVECKSWILEFSNAVHA